VHQPSIDFEKKHPDFQAGACIKMEMCSIQNTYASLELNASTPWPDFIFTLTGNKRDLQQEKKSGKTIQTQNIELCG